MKPIEPSLLFVSINIPLFGALLQNRILDLLFYDILQEPMQQLL